MEVGRYRRQMGKGGRRRARSRSRTARRRMPVTAALWITLKLLAIHSRILFMFGVSRRRPSAPSRPCFGRRDQDGAETARVAQVQLQENCRPLPLPPCSAIPSGLGAVGRVIFPAPIAAYPPRLPCVAVVTDAVLPIGRGEARLHGRRPSRSVESRTKSLTRRKFSASGYRASLRAAELAQRAKHRDQIGPLPC